MANQYKNKVVYNGTTLIDLSDTTAVQSDVASGKYFYLATGEKVEGTASGGDEPVTPTETLLGQTPYTLTEDATIRLKSTSETTYSTGSGVVKDFDDRENQTLTSATLTDQGTYWELADNGGAAWYASKMTFTISGLTANNTYTARIGAAGDGTTSISGYWLIYDQSSSTMDDTPLVSQALETTDGALQFTPTESTILVRVLPSQSYYWDQGIKTSRFSYFRIEGEVSGTFTGSVDLGQLSSGTTITSTPSCDVYAVIESSGSLSGKTCVCLGDSVTGLMAPPNDYPSVLASNTGMTVINGGFEGCRMSDTHPSATYAAFSAVKLADAIATGTWTTQDANISGFESGSYAPAHLTALKAVDWSDVDYITVEFGGNDAGDQYVYIDNSSNPTDTTTYVGAARYVYNRIHTAYPNIKIMFFVPMYRYWISEGKDSDEMTFTLGGNTYHYYDWGDALIASPPASGVPVIDMYRTLGINATNRQTYLLASDQTHPSVAGCELIAQKFETELTNHFLPSGGGSSATLITKTITANGTYNASDDSADGYSEVVVNVSSGGSETTYDNIVPLQTINCTASLSNDAYGGYINPYTSFTEEGEKYRVIFDGTTYKPLTAAYYGGGTNYLYVGDPNVQASSSTTLIYPFEVMLLNGQTFYLGVKGSGSHTLQVDKITSEGGGDATLITKTITANGTYSASDDSADGYSEVTVNVTPNLQSKSATPTTSSQTVSPDNGYNGLSSVTVGAIPSQYIVPTGNKAITENGTGIDVAEYATVSVNVPSSGVSITDGIVVTARDSNGYATAVDFYGTVVQSHQFYNRTTSTGGWINLSTISFKSGVVNEIRVNGFTACGNLTTIDLSSVETIGGSAFQDCKSLSLITVPELTSIGQQAFLGCTSLQTFVAPKLKNCGSARALRACTALTTVQVGSIGYNVTSIGNVFEQDTQTGLTITIYTKGSYVNTAVTNVRKGATNATIIIKASEATTYSGTSYAAGDTIVTSTP